MTLRHWLAAVVTIFCCLRPGECSKQVLLVSFDGFRADYFQKARTPFFDEFVSSGARALRMKSVFPTLTFPNHWSLVTGRYPENHDIISNSMFDPVSGDKFAMTTLDEKWWNTSEPVWLTAMKQNLTAATYFWPGSEVQLQGYRPKYWFKYSDNTPNLVRINEVVRWLKDDKINLATLYFNQPDSVGHSKGPDDPATKEMVEEMDSVLGYLMHKIKLAGLDDIVNVIICSDHGMAATNGSSSSNATSQVIRLPSLANWTCVEWSYASAVGLIWPKSGCLVEVYRQLNNSHPKMKVYLKEDLPARLHYSRSARIPPIVIIPDEGWTVSSNSAPTTVRGVHGYDNDLPSMTSMLVAKGPDFKRGYVKDEIDSVDLYPLVCWLLGIKPQAHDGKLSNTMDMVNPAILTDSSAPKQACHSLMLLSLLACSFLWVTASHL